MAATSFCLFVIVTSSWLLSVFSISPSEASRINCRNSSLGTEYTGTVNVTKEGLPCMSWRENTAFYPNYSEGYLEENYCRNPDKITGGPWCFVNNTRSGDVQTFKCSIPRCAEQVGCYDRDLNSYSGSQDTTESGETCSSWKEVWKKMDWVQLRVHRAYLAKIIYQSTVSNDNFCRNPDNSPEGPWCFYTSPRVDSCLGGFCRGSCGVPKCNRTEVKPTPTRPDFETGLGFPLLKMDKVDPDCPRGFVLRNSIIMKVISLTVKVNSGMMPYCILQQQYLHSLPSGFCLFQLVPGKRTCPVGFEIIERRTHRMFGYTYKWDKLGFFDVSNGIVIKRLCCFKNAARPTQQKNNTFDLSLNRPGDLLTGGVARDSGKCPQLLGTSLILYPFDHRFFRNLTLQIHYHMINWASDVAICYYVKPNFPVSSVEGRVGYFTTSSQCPRGFSTSTHPAVNILRRWPSLESVRFCLSNGQVSLPKGNYCLLQDADNGWDSPLKTCPGGGRSSRLNLVTGVVSQLNQTVTFCCYGNQDANSTSIEWPFKTDARASVVLIKFGSFCQDFKRNDTRTDIGQIPVDIYHLKVVKVDGTVFVGNVMQVLLMHYRLMLCHYEVVMNGFAIRRLNGVCPAGSEPGRLTYRMRTYPSIAHSDLYCSWRQLNGVLPKGQYCVYRIGKECPPEFNLRPAQSVRIISTDGLVPQDDFAYCCRRDAPVQEIVVPWIVNFTFALPSSSSSDCQRISGTAKRSTVMRARDAHLCIYDPVTDAGEINIAWSPNPRSYDHCWPRTTRILRNNWNALSFYRQKFLCRRSVAGPSVPRGNYCVVADGRCSRGFKAVGDFPYLDTVICCRSNSDSIYNLTNTWPYSVRTIGVLAKNSVCPVFKGYTMMRFYIHSYSYSNNFNQKSAFSAVANAGITVNTNNSYTTFQFKTCVFERDLENRTDGRRESTWPRGNYALPQPISGCPKGFSKGSITQKSEEANIIYRQSQVSQLQSGFEIPGSGSNMVTWSFCVRNDSGYQWRSSLPPGHYCILRVGGRCPLGFSQGTVGIVDPDEDLTQLHGSVPDIERRNGVLSYNFCCRSDSLSPSYPINAFPYNNGSFYLFKFGDQCQAINGTKVTQEFLCINGMDTPFVGNRSFSAPYRIRGFTPVSGTYEKDCDFQMDLCYYTSAVPGNVENTSSLTNGTGWPGGNYALLRTAYDQCPENFVVANLTTEDTINIHPAPQERYFLNSDDTPTNTVNITVCLSPDNVESGGRSWPKGRYCVVMTAQCPSDLMRYNLLSMASLHISPHSSFLPRTTGLSVCCKNDPVTDSLNLPNASSFVLLRLPLPGASCPSVKGMNVDVYLLQGPTASHFDSLCYYTPTPVVSNWPDGNYLLPFGARTGFVCPRGFEVVHHEHQSLSGNGPDHKLDFCSRTSKSNAGSMNWPEGDYCVITINHECPQNMDTSFEESAIIPGYHYNSISEGGYTPSRYLICCRQENRLISNFPANESFYLFGVPHCSDVHNMTVVSEFQVTPLRAMRDATPKPPFTDTATLRLCYYQKKSNAGDKVDCGCHEDAKCVTGIVSGCLCNSGFYGDGVKICLRVTNKTGPCAGACHPNATCNQILLNKTPVPDCRCSPGFVGNGFTCIADCRSVKCQPSSHCILQDSVASCECDKNTVPYRNRCNADLLTVLSAERVHPIFLIKWFSCFSSSTRKELANPQSKSRFLVFVPPRAIKNCDEARTHVAMIDAKDFKYDQPISSVNMLGTYLNLIYKDTLKYVNEVPIVNESIPYANGYVYFIQSKVTGYKTPKAALSGKMTPGSKASGIVVAVFVLLVAVGLILLVVYLRHQQRSPINFRRLTMRSSPSDGTSSLIQYSLDHGEMDL